MAICLHQFRIFCLEIFQVAAMCQDLFSTTSSASGTAMYFRITQHNLKILFVSIDKVLLPIFGL